MPLRIHSGAPTLFIRRAAYERSGLVRAALDQRLGLAEDEFRVEGDIVAIGPVFNTEAFMTLLGELEQFGLVYYDDFFELSGNWPEWLGLFTGSSTTPVRSKPSQPHS